MKYYVSMTDRFMSGWGMAEGKTNKLIAECNTYEEAKVLEKYFKGRSQMRYVSIHTKKPYYDSDRYYVSYKPWTQFRFHFAGAGLQPTKEEQKELEA